MGIDATLESVDQEIRNRDQADSQRHTAPLAAARDAVMIDTTAMDRLDVLRHIAAHTGKRFQFTVPDVALYVAG